MLIDWMPLLSYDKADPQSARFDFWQKVLCAGFLGFAVARATSTGGWQAAVSGLLLGMLLEGA